MNALPQPRYMHWKGLGVSCASLAGQLPHLPLVGVDTEVTREVALAGKRAVTVVVLANKGAHEEVVARPNMVAVVDELQW